LVQMSLDNKTSKLMGSLHMSLVPVSALAIELEEPRSLQTLQENNKSIYIG
jgi:hypothetical protein